MKFSPADTPPTPDIPQHFWMALGLTKAGNHSDWVDRHTQVREMATALPMALFVQLVAAIVMIRGSTAIGNVALVHATIMASAEMLGASLALAILLLVPPMRRWQPHQHARLAVVLGAAQSAGLVSMLWSVAALPAGDIQLAGFAATLGALGITGMAMHPIRAAILAFASVIVVGTIGFMGMGTPSLIALGCLLCLTISIVRLAVLDVETALRDARINDHGRLATRLVGEFENQGTGWFWQTDRHGNITYLSSKVAQILSIDGVSVIGQPLMQVFRMDSNAPGTERTLGFHLSSRTSFSDYSVCPGNQRLSDRWWSISGRPVTDPLGNFQGFIGSGNDLTEKRRAEAEITKLALFDGLTGLANRQRMRLSLDQTLHQSSGMRRSTGLFLLDLDRFKVVNDTLGHQMGDALLKQVAQRLLRSVGDAGLVGRLGGDEFQVVLPGASDIDQLSELARKVITALSHPYSIDGASISIGCSIGVAIAPGDGEDAETLIRNADLALYAAKADGRGIHRFYRAELLHGAQNRKQLEDDLRQALANDEFHLVYQPVVSTIDARIVGYEALLRWEHPQRGAISPADFVPIAEDCGMIGSIGEWVLRTACLDAAHWPRHVRVGVNVSPIQFANPALPVLVTNALAKAGIDASRLELEITEGVFLDESASTEQMFKSLKGIGVRLALDDFGTGYSSLGYLKSAPFDKIKIDQSFVRGAAIEGNRNAAIIRAIVTLAKTLDMETTAEGVENRDEIDLIRDLGCSHIQGFVYGRPVRAAQVIEQLSVDDGIATPSGFRVSRSPRIAMIKSAMIEIAGECGEVRIRNISSKGAMIDGIEFGRKPDNMPVKIELLPGQMFPARVLWANDGKAGLEFLETFNLARLNPEPEMPHMRKTG
jgi:diguanylate cyclase (GGDEF)-like protein